MLRDLLNVWLEFRIIKMTHAQKVNKAPSNQWVAKKGRNTYEFGEKQFLMYKFYLWDF